MIRKTTSWLLVLVGLIAWAPTAAATEPVLEYHIDLRNLSDDLFEVRLTVDGLGPENAVYQFASTAPGTYQVMDIGRYVRGFRALDGEGQEVSSERISPNQWRIIEPERVRVIEYSIAETWDTPVEEHPVYPMAGTSIELDHVLFNAHAVLGYPTGLQQAPIRLELDIPETWVLGTALKQDESGAYIADDYDHAVDSPILMGELTVAATEVAGAPVEIFTYSKSGGVRSEQLLEAMREMLVAEGEFLGELPVDRYVFLYHFENHGPINGAWEHSYSSEYTLPDLQYSEHVGGFITDIAAHEFLHIITPLNIHSEIIEHFNFVEPVPSAHLWLYEGVTEWAAHASQLRAGLKSPEQYLDTMASKMNVDRANFDPDYSLEKLALTSYGPEGQSQYANIYQRGALVAGLLDILLLDLSEGSTGLQQLLQELMVRYGKERPFDDCCFHDVVTEMTFPEVADFFDRYVKRAEPLPIEEYYGKLGIDLVENENGEPVGLEISDDADERQLKLRRAWQGEKPLS